MRKFILAALLLFFLSSVHAQELTDKLEKNYVAIGPSTGAASIIHLDINADGRYDAVGIIDDNGGRVLTVSFSGSQMWSLLMPRGTSDGAIAAADFKGSGYLGDVVAGSRDVYAIDGSSGGVLWKFSPASSVYSLAVVDFNGDGKLNEVVVGGWGVVYALSSSGSVLWNYVLSEGERNAESLAGVDLNSDGVPEAVVVGANKRVLLLDAKGNLIWSADTSSLVQSVIAADLDSTGYLNTIVAGSSDGNVTAFDSNGNMKWINKLYLESGQKIKLYAMDAESKGRLNYVLAVSAGSYVSLLYPSGMVRWSYRGASNSAAPIDLNADGKFEGVVIGGATTLHFVNPNGQQVGYYVETYDSKERNVTPYNITGADVIISADIDGDGFLDDAIGISSYTIFGVKHTPAAVARPTKIIVVANLIDYSLAADFFEFLRNSKVEPVHVLPQNLFKYQYQLEKNIVILGGHKAPDGTGDIVKAILPPASQQQLEVKGAQKIFTLGAIWSANQKVVVLAGYNREDTRWAHVKYRANVF